MNKIAFIVVMGIITSNVFAGGFDFSIGDKKCFSFDFDINPFSRDDGREKVYRPVYTPQYYTPPPPPRKYRVITDDDVETVVSKKKKIETSGIIIKDSKNVKINIIEEKKSFAYNDKPPRTTTQIIYPQTQTSTVYYPTTSYYTTYPTVYYPNYATVSTWGWGGGWYRPYWGCGWYRPWRCW